MKKLFYPLFVALLFGSPIGAQTSATYSLGDIPTEHDFNPISTVLESSCTDTLTVNITPGDLVMSVDVSYDMTSTSGAWLSEQFSYIECVTTSNKEASFTNGTGSTGGTFSYTRNGLNIANGISATGELKFVIHAFRSFGNPFQCVASQAFVNNNSWTITVNHIPPPTCPFPSNLQVQSVSSNSALVGWVSGGATNWQIEYGPVGFAPGSGTLINTSSNPQRITGLNAFTSYDFYVRDSCGAGDVSAWIQGSNFQTLCAPTPAPWTNSFQGAPWVPGTGFFNTADGINQCFDRTPGGIPAGSFNGPFYWGTRTGGTPSFQSGPSNDHTFGNASGKYVYTVAALANAGDQAFISTRLVDLSPLNVPELRFWYHMYGTDIGTLTVQVDNGNGYVNVWSLSGQQQTATTDPWLEAIIPLPQFAGDTVRVQFLGISNNGNFNGDIAIDDISLDEAPSCPQPNGLVALGIGATDVNIDWQPGLASNWNVQFGPPGFTPGAGTNLNASSHPFNITGLTPDTDYDIYVRDSCGAGDVSVWVGPLSIRTNCLPFVTPYTEDFESASWVSGTGFNNANDQIDPCWDRDPGQQTGFNGDYFWGTFTGATQTFNTGPSGDHTTGSGKYIYVESSFVGAGSSAEIITPLIDLSNLNVPELRFWYHFFGASTGTLDVEVNNGNGWSNVFSLSGQQQSAASDPWLEAIVNMSAYAGDTIQLRLTSTSIGGGNGDMAIDDLSLLEAPSCPQPSSLVALSIGSDNVNLDWVSGASDNNISFGPVGTSAGAGTIVNSTGAPFNLTGLSPNTSYDIYVRDSCAMGDVSVWIGPLTITTNCLPFPTPWTENFDGASWVSGTGFQNSNDAIDNCWTRDPEGNSGGFNNPFFWGTRQGPTSTFGTGPDFDHTSGSGKYVYTEASNNGSVAEILSPLVDLTNLTIPELRFWYHLAGPTMGTLDVDVNDGSGWTNIFSLSGPQQTATNDPWLEAIVSLAAYASDTVQFRFTNSNGTFQNDMAIDDVTVIETPNCTQPSALTLDAVSSNSGTISWTTGGATAWQIEYGPTGFTPGNGTIVNALTNPFTITGLSANTSYSAYVRDSCAVGNVGVWVGAIDFSTTCLPFAAPWVEDFESANWVSGAGANNENSQIDNCWARDPGANSISIPVYSWGTRTGGTASAGTGPSQDHTTGSGNYVFTEASGGFAAGAIAEFESPLIDLTALTNPELRFWYHMAGGSMGDLNVEVNDGSGYVNVWSQSGSFQNAVSDPWEEVIISLSAYANDTVRIRFEGVRGTNFLSDMAIDDVSIDEAPACPQPTNLQIVFESSTSIELSWNVGGSASDWQIEYGAPGFTPGTGTIVNANTNPFTVNGLTANTAYEFYVRDSCGLGSVSVWEGPEAARTACTVATAPFSENFDLAPWVSGTGGNNASDAINPCWVRTPDGSPTYSWGTRFGGTSSFGTGPSSGNGGSGNYLYTEASNGGNGDRAYIESPLIDLSSLTIPELSFHYHMFGPNIDSLTVEVNNGSGYVFLGAIVGQQQTSNAAAWLPQLYSLSAYAGDTVRIRFNSQKLGFTGDLAIDDFEIQEALACPAPNSLSVNGTGSSSISLDWTSGGASTWQIEYGPVGFTPGSGTILNVTSPPPFSVNGLSPSTTYSFYVRDSCGLGSVSTWDGPVSASTACAVFATPYIEDFESGLWVANGTFAPGDIDSCWTRTTGTNYWWKGISGATPTVGTGPSSDHTTGSGSYMYTETNSSTILNTEILSPEIDLVPLTNPELRFWYHMFGGLINNLEIFVESGGASTSVLTLNGSVQSNQADPWLEAIVDLSAFVGDTIRLRFEAERNPGANNQVDISIDDISIDEAPACPNPSNLLVTSSTTTDVDLSWTTAGATAWQIEYGPVGFAPGTGTIINATTNPFTVTGLSPSTTYDFYVRDSCAAGSVSSWTGPTIGSTACGVAVAPYFQNFDLNFDEGTGADNTGSTIDPCWTRNPVTGYHWGGGQGTTPTGNTGPTADHTSGFGNYVYAEASFTTPGLTAELETPDIDLSPLTLPELRFWYHMSGANMGSLRIDINDGTSWTNGIDSIVGDQGTNWLEKRILLSANVGQTVRIRFVGRTGTAPTQFGDIAIDDLSIIEGPTCPFPSFLTSTASTTNSISLSWTSGGSTNWQIEYGAPGFTPGTGTLVNATTNPFTLTGLTAGTNYQFYVRDSCGLADVSDWEGPTDATTACGVVLAPYTENFDLDFDEGTGNDNAGSTIDPCWTRNPVTGYHWGGGQGTTPTGTTGPTADHTTGNGNYVYAEASFTTPGLTAELETPDIDLSPLTLPELRFWYHMSGTNMGSLRIDINDGTSWTNGIDSIVGDQGTNWLEKRILLSANVGQTVRIRFVGRTGTTPTQFGDIAIDDLSIIEGPTCPFPSFLTSTASTTNSITLSWTSGGSTNWQIEYGAPGFTPGTGTIVNATTNPFTVTGLGASATYEFYVRDSCGVADVSDWTGPISASTSCGTIVAPYFENFDVNFDEGTGADNAGSTIDPCWTRNPVTGYHWGGGQGGTPTGNTGPSADHTSGNGNYVYAEASFTNPGLTADLESPLVDLSALTTPELVFWYHMFGASLGDLQVDVFDGTAWVTNVDQIVGDQGNQWFERRVDLSAFAGQTIRLRFVAATGIVPTQLGDIAIDDLSIDEAPTCPVPSAFTSALIGDTSATFTWTSGGASNWQIEYGPAGFTPGTGTIVNASTNPFTLTGLSPLTSYSFYLRDSCGTGDVSDWVGPVDLTTLNCSVGCNYNLRLTDSFGDGWDAFTGNFHEVIITVGGTPTSYTLLAGNQEDFTITFCDGDQFDVDFVNAGQWSQECGILVTDPAGATVYQRLPGTALGTGNLFSSIADCSSAIACADPSGLGAQGITQSTADLVFNSPGGTSRIEYGPTGFTPGTGTLITLVTSSPFTATGLTSNTSYDFYVQDSCGLGVTSNWVGPFTFTTNNCPPVTANFTYTVTGTTINVDGTSSSASFFTWDFGGQGASFDSVATYTFGTEGSYDVTLINSNGCGSTDTMTVTLDFCTPLTASFTEITNFLDVDLNAVGSLGLPTQYDWDFGDGNSTTTTGVLTNHTYATDGLYTVTLVLTNACGETDTVTSDIQVCDIISGNIAYSFTGTTFSFDGSGSSTNAVDFQWYFGDGGQDTVSNPSYTYTSSGTYNVSLVVTNACGESDSVTIPVTVCAKPNASWTFSVIQTSPFGMEVQFDASSSTGAISYSWDFGDGGTNNTSGFPIHTYNTPGFFYVVTLIVYNSCGDSDTLRSSLASIGLDNPQLGDELNIYPNPTSDFVQINWSGLPTDDPVHIELVDVQGRSVQSFDRELNQGNLELRLDLTGLAKGPYFIRMRQGRRELLRKLILD